MKKKYYVLIVSIAMLFTIYNLYNFKKDKLRYTNILLDEFLIENCNRSIDHVNWKYYNFYIVTTPAFCELCDDKVALDTALIKNIRQLSDLVGQSASINYIIGGDCSLNDKTIYIKKLSARLDGYYFVDSSKIFNFLYYKFQSFHLPFLLLLDQNRNIKYWESLDLYHFSDIKKINKNLNLNMRSML